MQLRNAKERGSTSYMDSFAYAISPNITYNNLQFTLKSQVLVRCCIHQLKHCY